MSGGTPAISFLKKHWFLVTLLVILVAAFSAPGSIAPVTNQAPAAWLVAAVMLLTAIGVDLRASATQRSVWTAAAIAIAVNAVAAPICGWISGLALRPDLAVGMVIATSVPCTLASAAVWTRRGRGNDAVALLVTVVTNLACFIVLPGWTALLAGVAGEVDFRDRVVGLLVSVVLPIVVAQMLRMAPAVANAVSAHRKRVSILAQIGVLTIAALGAVRAGEALYASPDGIGPVEWIKLLAAVAAAHLGLAALAWFTAMLAGLAYPERLAAAIAGSQKTLAVGVLVALQFGGLSALPMIAYHAFQLVVDTVLVDHLRERQERQRSEK